MTRIRHALRRVFTWPAPTADVHFHRRGEVPEACFDDHCRLPRLTV